MTDYGQSIPPKWFRDQSVKLMSKMATARYLHRALMAVGMLPIRLLNPYGDFETAAFAEYPVELPSSTNDSLFWFYDYPTSETFVVNGVSYRPCFCMVALEYVGNSVLSNVVGENIGFHHFYRRDDVTTLNSLWNLARLEISGSNLGLSTAGTTFTTPWQANEGAYTNLWNWLPYSGYNPADTNHQTLMNIQNVHIILGKGGLLIQIGNGITKTDSANLINCMAAFGGARIPGRARIPASDPNLNRINPVVWLDFITLQATHYYTTSGSVTGVSTSGTRLQTYSMAMQHDLNVTQEPVRLVLQNLENLERPFYGVYDLITKNSPRSVGGSGSHILNRIIYGAFAKFGGGTQPYFAPVNPSIRPEPIWAWEDLWTFPGLRAADNTAPYGEFEDPITLTNWFLFRAPNMNGMLAVDVEGLTKITTLPAGPSYVLANDYPFNINTGFASTPNVFPGVQSVPSAPTPWVAVPANNEMTNVTSSTAQINYIQFDFALPETDGPDVAYDLYFEAYAKMDSGATPATTANVLEITCTAPVNGTTDLTMFRLANAGATSGHPSFNYALYGPIRVTRRAPAPSSLRIRFIAHHDTSAVNHRFGVRNIHIKRTTR